MQLNKAQQNLASMQAKSEAVNSTYVPAKGTENLVHAKIVYGTRFNPNTGKEESTPYVQTFTMSEYRVFESAAERLGFKVLEVLYKPNK